MVFDPCQPIVLETEGADLAQKEGVARALASWNEGAFTRLTLEPLDAAARLPVRFEPAALAFRGLYDDERGIVIVNAGISDLDQRAVVVAHEIGHAFGLTHVDRRTRTSLMNGGNITVGLTSEDVEALASRWGRCGAR
jgi:hypothetical protein